MDIRKQSKLFRTAIGCMSLMLLQLNSPFVNADGLETLGTPSTTILGPGQDGTGIISKGVGTELVQPGVINFNVPTGATVERALLYWEGYMFDGLGDDQILVDGNPVDGTLIQSGVLEIQTSNPDADSTAYRADITTLVSPGANSLSISGMDFDRVNHGAGVLVIINDGSAPAHIDVLDGNDFAYAPYAPLQDTTVEQVFSFAADTVNDRTATLDMMFASVAGDASGGTFRPSSIKVTVGASGTPVYYNDQLNSNDGQEWDSLQIPLTIPAGADQVKAQALSEDRGTTGGSVASFHWLTAGLAITPPPPPVEMQGRFTGGGKIKDNGVWVKAAFTLHCDITLSNNLQINWKGHKWHLKKPITDATCIDNPDISPVPPAAPIDTFIGEGEGKLDGKNGSFVRFTFVDAGEPGKGVDSAAIRIWKPGSDRTGEPDYQFSGLLKKGNYQAHYDQPHK